FDLLSAVNVVLQRFAAKREDLRDIYEDKWTVSEKIEHVMKLLSERATLKFSELFADAASRSEVVCTFLALLELIRLKQLICAKSEAFGEIEIQRGSNAPGAPASGAARTDTLPETEAVQIAQTAPATEPAR